MDATSLNDKREKKKNNITGNQDEATEALSKRLNKADESRRSIQEELHNMCEKWRK